MGIRPFLFCCLAAGLLGAGCSSTRQIETAPPQSAVLPDTSATATLAALTIMVETGATTLPGEIQAMRFSVAEVQLKPAGGDWRAYPADVNSFVIAAGQRMRKRVLATQVPPAAYDSLALSLADVYVQYDANAGGPLTLPRGIPLQLPLTTTLVAGRRTTLRLRFEPGASLSRDARCRWFFLPVFETIVE